MRGGLLLGVLLASASAAGASDVPAYRPAPDWVKPAPPIDAAKLDDSSPILLVLDNQQRIASGEVWTYSNTATRIASAEILGNAGTVSIPWRPAKGDLIIHALEIIRGAERIDLLKGDKRFAVLRREQQLEQRQLDGLLTATMAVEGLRIGDVLHLAASVTARETAFGAATQAAAVLPVAPFRVGYARARLLWPATEAVRWKTYADGAAPVVMTAGDMRELTLTGALPEPAPLPDDAPVRYRKLPIVEATTFADWSAVSRINAPLYVTAGLIAPGGDLAGEVSRIAAASSDPLERTAAALQLVQDKVRYLFNGMENGNYVPQLPAQTWASRYGDCKAKTLLLLAILRNLKIEAEPVLASSRLGDLLPERLPSAGAFDHVLVRATVNGETLWLDGTANGTRRADLRDAPPFRHVLPIRGGGAELAAVPLRAPARPMVSIALDLDQSAGITMPTLFDARVTLRGGAAENIGLIRTQGSKEQRDQIVRDMVGKIVGGDIVLSGSGFAYDAATGEATVKASGLVTTLWRREDGRRRLLLDRTLADIDFSPNRARSAWSAIPVATGDPSTTAVRTSVRLPAGLNGVTLDGDARLDDVIAGGRIRRIASLTGDRIVVEDRTESAGEEIAPAAIAAARSRAALAKTRLLRAVAPADLPPSWETAAAGLKDGRFKATLATYAAAIADDPKDQTGYLNRAAFYEGLHDHRAALRDVDAALAIDRTAAVLVRRAGLLRELGEDARATADLQAARKLDPADVDAMRMLAYQDLDHGRRDAALAAVQERIDLGGSDTPQMSMLKATLLARAGEREAALAAADEAVAARASDPGLLNERCWMKAQLNSGLDAALKDCTKAIALSDDSTAALDSRALVYWRMNKPEDALADLMAALEQQPELAGSLYLRGVIRSHAGDAAGSRADLAAARTLQPRIDEDYKRFGIAP